MAPRAGKTTSLAVPAILSAPGAVIATSNKADLWTATAHDLLTSLLLAAGTSGHNLTDAYAWLNDPVLTTPGDTSMASLHEVEALATGGSARVRR